ncbi:MAG: hypothetical protein NZ700_01320, partial [Gemmataceae bacterium]|nr:hypothetical protein [Gemmataceae bacterium]MDW8266393.1 hypothetical protein [Gemmataceae bacterium]
MSDKLVEYQKAFLLLQLLAADQRQLSQGAANQALKGPARKLLALDPTTANRLRDALAVEGYLERTRVGRAVAYKLTARGVGLLLRLEQYPSGTLVPGRWINELLRAARDTSAARPPAAPVDSTPLLRE